MDDDRLGGRDPEFSSMSLRPGIGFNAMHDVADSFLSFNLEKREADVPSALRRGKSGYLPIAKYLKQNLRKMVGFDEDQVTLQVRAEKENEMRDLYKAQGFSRSLPGWCRDAQFKETLVALDENAARSIEARQMIYKRRKL